MNVIDLNATNVEIIIGVHAFFNDIDKVVLWLETDNSNLGGSSPVGMMNRGRSKKLLKFVDACLNENKPMDVRQQ